MEEFVFGSDGSSCRHWADSRRDSPSSELSSLAKIDMKCHHIVQYLVVVLPTLLTKRVKRLMDGNSVHELVSIYKLRLEPWSHMYMCTQELPLRILFRILSDSGLLVNTLYTGQALPLQLPPDM
jgi:hypothetical protein